MVKLFKSLRAALLLGKAQKLLEQRRFAEVLQRTQKAKSLELDPHFELLCFSLEGKSRAHLEDFDNAMKPLQAAKEIAKHLRQVHPESTHLQNIEQDIDRYLEKVYNA